ncbi:hypothetical protein LMG28688_04926 [Paraburkholderia caffeinitolerans]|uniref:Uncharacterized protein n=1 Tax=Paraburkholderia caffeinitolerans TaxID=1723730 RepID=A0A6J5GHH5_9BURK|nr:MULTISPECIES: FHA domain-containing protein [Paraburkholderia]CAB3799374.1 hypothetical protein LMG28688_04926 [Paraburkholderia caffeinitolerans]
MTEQSSFGIKISVLTCNGAAPVNAIGTEFGATGGTIGAGPANTLVLPDDTSGVAAHHADLRCVSGGWRMRNISERGTLTVNGKPLMPGGDMRVGVGDFIGLGPYVLRVAPGLVAPDWRADIPSRPMDATKAASAPATAPEALHLPRQETGPLSGAPSAGWLSDGSTLLESPIAFGDLTDMPVDPLALFGSVNRAWPGTHNPQAADLFGEEVSLTPRADSPPAPLEPRSHMNERRMPNELHSAFSMNVSTLMPEHHDDALRTGAAGHAANIAPNIAPLSRDPFEIHGLADAPDQAAPAAPANPAVDQQPGDTQWNAAAEQASVPMKVRYDTHFGAGLHDVTPMTFAGQSLRSNNAAVSRAAMAPPMPAPGARAAASGASGAMSGMTMSGVATPDVVTPDVATPRTTPPSEPRRHEAVDSRARPAPRQTPEAADDRFAVLRASFPGATAPARSENRAAPMPADIIDPLERHAASTAQPLPMTQEDTVAALVAAFFAGAGIAPHEAATAGLDTEFMYTLGGVARTLLARRIGSS